MTPSTRAVLAIATTGGGPTRRTSASALRRRNVQVHTGSALVGALGATSLTLGALGVLRGGAALIPFALIQDPQHEATKHTFLTAGGAAIGTGVALVVLGVVLGVVSTTHVYDGEGTRLAQRQGVHLTPAALVF